MNGQIVAPDAKFGFYYGTDQIVMTVNKPIYIYKSGRFGWLVFPFQRLQI